MSLSGPPSGAIFPANQGYSHKYTLCHRKCNPVCNMFLQHIHNFHCSTTYFGVTCSMHFLYQTALSATFHFHFLLATCQKRCASFVLFSSSMLSATGKAYTMLRQNEWCYSGMFHQQKETFIASCATFLLCGDHIIHYHLI